MTALVKQLATLDFPLYYYNCALCGSASAGVNWHDIRIKYAQYGMAIGYTDTQVNDSQFVNCLTIRLGASSR